MFSDKKKCPNFRKWTVFAVSSRPGRSFGSNKPALLLPRDFFSMLKQHLWFLQQHFRLTHPSVFFCTEDHDKPPLSSIWCFFVFVVWVRWRSFLQLQHREHQVLSTMSLEKQGIWRHGIFVGCVCALTIKGLDNSLKLWIVSSSYF